MKIYTKTGDKGTSSLYSGERVSKASRIFNVLGEVDRLNCDLGFVRSYAKHECVSGIRGIQSLLISIGSCIGTRPSNRKRYEQTRLTQLDDETKALEEQIDEWTGKIPPLRTFLTPGDSEHSNRVHAARTTCRGLERLLVALCDDTKNEIVDIQNSIDDGKKILDGDNKDSIQSEINDMVKLYDDTVTLLDDLKEISKYVNRLSDYLFTLARYIEEYVEKEGWGWRLL